MKRIQAAAFTAVAALALAACGGGGNNSGSGGTSSTPATGSSGGMSSASSGASPNTTQSALAKLNGQTVTVAAVWSGDEQKAFQKVLQGFEQATGATVKYTSTGDDIATVLGTRESAGNPPDVAIIPQPGLIQQFVSKGYLQPVPSAVKSIVQSNYAPVWTQLGTFNNKFYAVYFKAANKSTVWYKTAAFNNAGINNPPQTWPDFVNDLKTLRASGVQGPLSIGAGDGWVLTDWFENVYLRTAGPTMYDKLTQHKIKWTDSSVTKALKILANLWSQKQLIINNPLQTAFADSVTKVFNGSAAVVYEGDFVAGVIASSTKTKVGQGAKFFAFPSINNSPASVVGGGDAAVMMKNSIGAKALLAYLATPQAPEIWVKIGGFTSPNKSVPLSDYPDAVSRQVAQQVINAQTFKFDMSDQEPSQFGGTPGQGEWQILQGFFANPSSISSTQQKLEQAASKAYSSSSS